MPCGWRPGGSEWAEEIEAQQEKKIGLLENMLCQVLTAIEVSGFWTDFIHEGSEVTRWWHAHKEKDRRREALEAAERKAEDVRDRALAKLSIAEREALGIRKR